MTMGRRTLLALASVGWLGGCGGAAAPPTPPASPPLVTPTAQATSPAAPTTVPPVATSPAPVTAAPTVPAPATAAPTVAPTQTAAPVVTIAPTASVAPTSAPAAGHRLLVTNGAGRHVSVVEPARGVGATVEVGAAPFGLALAAEGRAYVSTAEGVAVVDVRAGRRLALIAYERPVGPVQVGEYRPGGMGIAVAPDGRRVYVAVYRAGEPSRLEAIDPDRAAVVGSVAVGLRPFQVLTSRDGRAVYTIDHDGYGVTVVEAATLAARTLPVAPLGRGAFDKPHYAALRPDGRLLLPIQGRALVTLDPATGASEMAPLTAQTHQHGVALTPDGGRLLVVGTGPAGGVSGGPSLSIIEVGPAAPRAVVLPLTRPHEGIAVAPDGRTAYLAGGYLLGGWDGLTVVDLQTGATREVAVPDRPQEVVVLPDGG